MGNLNEQIPVVVVYQKRKGGKHYMEIFKHLRVDDIIDAKKRKNAREKFNNLDLDKGAPLKGKLLIQMFEKSSLRTRLSFF